MPETNADDSASMSVDPISLLITTVVCTHPAGWGEVLCQTLTPLQ